MSAIKRAAPFLFLQFIPLLIFPPDQLQGAFTLIIIVIGGLVALSFMVWRGRSWALTMSIFLQGLNVIIRVMMLLSRAVSPQTGLNAPFLITSLLSIGLSWFLLYRFDRPELRAAMVA
jgi:hypothetical protein